jgi:peroxiredoxin Q/BCP
MKGGLMSIKNTILAFSAFCCSFFSPKLQVGDVAPDFTLVDEMEQAQTLTKLRGNKVALCFYPKDNTPGCTVEACSLRDGWDKLQAAGVSVLGINYDAPATHKKFAQEHRLPYALLSDTDKKVSAAYGATQWPLPMPKRITFIIDEQGKISHIINKVRTRDHAGQILEALKK